MIKEKKLDIVWNITQICMWDCGVCCVDAVYVNSKDKKINIYSDSLKNKEIIIDDRKKGHIYEQVLTHRVKQRLELSLEEKLNVLNNLRGFNAKIDFSGGDPLAINDTKIVMQKASFMFGKENITLTATGGGLARNNLDEIIPYIGELNFTYDSSNHVATVSRPKGYAKSNLLQANRCREMGAKVRAELPLTTNNVDLNTLSKIYCDLHECNIDTLLVMRLFPSGRGFLLKDKIPSISQYKSAIKYLYDLENKYKYPKIKLQCALKFLDMFRYNDKNPCDLVTESFGLLPDGTLLASPWAINEKGKALSDIWVLGNLAKTKMKDILSTHKVKTFISRSNENFGHCKIQSYFSNDRNHEAIFKKSDPLYIETSD